MRPLDKATASEQSRRSQADTNDENTAPDTLSGSGVVVRPRRASAGSGNGSGRPDALKLRLRTMSRPDISPIARAHLSSSGSSSSSSSGSLPTLASLSHETSRDRRILFTSPIDNRKYSASSPKAGIYSDKRMSESAVEIMSVLTEGEESSLPSSADHSPHRRIQRRAVSDKVVPLRNLSVDADKNNSSSSTKSNEQPDPCDTLSSSETASSVTNEPSRSPSSAASVPSPSRYGWNLGGSANGYVDSSYSGSSASSISRVPVSRYTEVRQSTGSIVSSVQSATSQSSATTSCSESTTAELLGLRPSPRLIRKRTTSNRSNSLSPQMPRSSTSLPLPDLPGTLLEGSDSEVPTPRSESPSPYRPPDVPFPNHPLHLRPRTTAAHPDASIEGSEANVEEMRNSKLIRPRQHKRWNSEVYDQPIAMSRHRHDPIQLRSRHDSFAPNSPSPTSSTEQGGSAQASAIGGLKRRSVERAQSMDAAKQRLVLQEPGKTPTIFVSWWTRVSREL